MSRSASKLCTCRPKALRRATMSMRPEQRLVAFDDLAGQRDEPGAGAEHRHAAGRPRLDRRDETVVAHELADRRALAAGDDQRVDRLELGRPPDLGGGGAQTFEHGAMLAKVALQRQHADARRAVPAPRARVANSGDRMASRRLRPW